MKAVVKENIIISDQSKQLEQKIQQLLWVHNEDYIKKIRLNKWIGKTPPKLSLYIKDRQNYIVPYGFIDELKEFIPANNLFYLHHSHPIKFKRKSDINLYPYQEKAVNEILKHNNGILISPAGSGKTRMAMEIIARRGVKTLWLTHTLDLLKQSKKVFKEFFSNSVGEISGGKIEIGDITFATIQTLSNSNLVELKDSFEMVLTDECHRIGGTPTNLTMFYKILSSLNAKYKYGVTATLFPKENYASITPIYLIGSVKHEVLGSEVDKIPATYEPIYLNTPVSNSFLNPDKTINYNELLNHLVYDQERNNAIFENLMKNKDKFNIILTNRNDHIKILSDMLDVFGIKNRVLIGDEKVKEREIIQDDFKAGKFHFLLSNYQLAKEGLDLPIADTLHLIMPMRDKKTIIQSKGRVERKFEGKESSVVYDYIDTNIFMLLNMSKERKRYFFGNN